jgi:putative intracellular protease/amidase
MMKKVNAILLILLFSLTTNLSGGHFPDTVFDSKVKSPKEFFGFEAGEVPLNHAQILGYFQYLNDNSQRTSLFYTGTTHEGRKLLLMFVGSAENIANLNAIQQQWQQLAAGAASGTETTPGLAWMMYNIHGDEMSGADAAVRLAYYLAAGSNPEIDTILDQTVVAIDPIENPDGRDRYLAAMQQWQSQIENDDVQSLHHSGLWPGGRGNHYLFDLNRDWFILSQPESRARMKMLTQYHPHLVVDAHEMGPTDTYLFNPPREPFNPYIPAQVKKWWATFARDQAKRFDRFGWSYYTGEWFEEWYPGYGSSIMSYGGTISILYEQASADGTSIKRHDGTKLYYRDAVHRQFESSIANILTLAKNKDAYLRDFAAIRRTAATKTMTGKPEAYLVLPGSDRGLFAKTLENLQLLGIEVSMTAEKMRLRDATANLGMVKANQTIAPGAAVIKARQPLQRLIHATLEFETPLKTRFLQEERKSILTDNGSRLYEVSAWSYLTAANLQAYALDRLPDVRLSPFSPQQEQQLPATYSAAFGYMFLTSERRARRLVVDLLAKEVQLRVAIKPFVHQQKAYSPGTILIRKNENAPVMETMLFKLAADHQVALIPVGTALSDKGPDLGGNRFKLLQKPRVALIGGTNVSGYTFGAAWHSLDQFFGLKHTLLANYNLHQADLRKYNVIILPELWGNHNDWSAYLNKSTLAKLKTWVQQGGTLIAIGNGAAFLADTTQKFVNTRLRSQVLKELPKYTRTLPADLFEVDSLAIWHNRKTGTQKNPEKDKADVDQIRQADELGRKLMPRGVMMNTRLNPESFVNFGLNDPVASLLYSNYAFLHPNPNAVVASFGDRENLRISGLIWPEAADRLAQSAWIVREQTGKGQVILFADDPNFRGYFAGTIRQFYNAVVFGPGAGANAGIPW